MIKATKTAAHIFFNIRPPLFNNVPFGVIAIYKSLQQAQLLAPAAGCITFIV
jgi:hypothetical protein